MLLFARNKRTCCSPPPASEVFHSYMKMTDEVRFRTSFSQCFEIPISTLSVPHSVLGVNGSVVAVVSVEWTELGLS